MQVGRQALRRTGLPRTRLGHGRDVKKATTDGKTLTDTERTAADDEHAGGPRDTLLEALEPGDATLLRPARNVEHVLVLQRTGNPVNWVEGRDKWWHEETNKVPNYCPPALLSAEDPLFILYVSQLVATQEMNSHFSS